MCVCYVVVCVEGGGEKTEAPGLLHDTKRDQQDLVRGQARESERRLAEQTCGSGGRPGQAGAAAAAAGAAAASDSFATVSDFSRETLFFSSSSFSFFLRENADQNEKQTNKKKNIALLV